MGGDSIPSMGLSNVGSQFVPPTSQTTRGSYVPALHNISHLPPLAVGSSGHDGLGPIGPVSQPPTSAWVQRSKIGNQYLSGAQYNNHVYVPYPGGVTNQWDQPTFEP